MIVLKSELTETVWSVFAITTVSKLLLGIQHPLKILIYFLQTSETGISDFLKMTVTLMKILINSKNQKQFNTEIANILMRNLLILNWAMSCWKLILTMLSWKSLANNKMSA